jgi:hypothetical protein
MTMKTGYYIFHASVAPLLLKGENIMNGTKLMLVHLSVSRGFVQAHAIFSEVSWDSRCLLGFRQDRA